MRGDENCITGRPCGASPLERLVVPAHKIAHLGQVIQHLLDVRLAVDVGTAAASKASSGVEILHR